MAIKATFLTISVSRRAGGLFHSVRRLAQSLEETSKMSVQVLATHDEDSDEDIRNWLPLSPELVKKTGPAVFGYSPGLYDRLVAFDPDIVRVDGLWTYCSSACLKWSKNTGRPHIVAPRGMLDSWALNHSRWKKLGAAWFFENEHLRRAACLHALCKSESEAMREFGLRNPICVISNGIDIPEVSSQQSAVIGAPWETLIQQEKKVLLFLSRIHTKKGLVNLLKAWKQTLNSLPSALTSWILAIAGWDQGGHEDELKRLATELGIVWRDLGEHPISKEQTPDVGDEIRIQKTDTPSSILDHRASLLFLGPQFNEAKAACYRNCDAFILPSFSEGLPMVVLEAWAYGKPVLMTAECNLPEGFLAHAAIRIETSAEGIAQGLQELFRTSHSALRILGEHGRQLVAERFTWPKVAAEMRSVYEWLLGGGPKPECILD